MTPVQEMVHRYHQLSAADRLSFYMTLTNTADIDKENMQELQMEVRFKEDQRCMHCGSSRFVKNGHRNDGTQRFLCRECGKSFLASTNSIVSGTHKRLSVWKKYFECLMEAKTLKASAEECGISMGTAFQWRHRILDCMQKLEEKVCLDGTVEADETFFNLSYKGNHSGSSRFSMPREPHARGGGVHAKGLSGEKVCVLCAVNEDGIPVAKVGKLGKVSRECVEKALSGHISPDAVLVTDNEKAYIGFSEALGARLVQMDTDRRVKGSFNIQRVSAYHSCIKSFVSRFKGVSTKYLDNYLAWYNLVVCSPEERRDTAGLLMCHALGEEKKLLWKDLADRPAVPALV